MSPEDHLPTTEAVLRSKERFRLTMIALDLLTSGASYQSVVRKLADDLSELESLVATYKHAFRTAQRALDEAERLVGDRLTRGA